MKNIKNQELLSTTQVAEKLGISRVAVFNKIKKGEINAQRVGRSFAIREKELPIILDKPLTKQEEKEIDKAVEMVVRDYGRTLELLADN